MIRLGCLIFSACLLPLAAKELVPVPSGLSDYALDVAPETSKLLLKKGDLLAICGDSITEQRRYSVLMETYIAACLPELQIRCRQYGWSGEKADGFLGRMKSDVLRFKPDVATTCYGMNDFRYVAYQDDIAAEYRKNQESVVKMFKDAGCKVVLGSPGIIDSVPPWVKNSVVTQKELNLSLSRFRNIDVDIAGEEQVPFADVYTPMLLADYTAKTKISPDFKTSGNDGVHPDWAGHVVMAYAFLKGLGFDGNLGTITYDDSKGTATATGGHEVLSTTDGKITLRSNKLAFCPGPGPLDKFDSIQTGMELVAFDDDLNRFILQIPSPKAASYQVTWGDQTKSFSAAEMKSGINLPKEFDANPMVGPFNKIEEAVARKQAYETRQIKDLAHGPEGSADIDETFDLSEKARAPLADQVAKAFRPLEHTITIVAGS
ncbi:SGNH/GDSL hydrolase family protein [Luteolibacter pohnpeiensis]|uniref:SGNH/GDSL hydrolase family protein n=1 Tax=Luteolibacter pohnpeiensis TaxID=454153 RepID=A0A934S982_9BACT|nr:SGNH/GDSL hydrolase family protein [Luteolibacter pohnpeiensis]MBK1881997.1 SGNH/GDSL hydrolase family protein [Luteolibacter pohnpeiensis]